MASAGRARVNPKAGSSSPRRLLSHSRLAKPACLLRDLLVTGAKTSGGGGPLPWAFSRLFPLPGPQIGAVGFAHLVFKLTVRLRIDCFSAF